MVSNKHIRPDLDVNKLQSQSYEGNAVANTLGSYRREALIERTAMRLP